MSELLKRYKDYQKNLIHNIKFDIEQRDKILNNPYYSEEQKQRVKDSYTKSIAHFKGQLAIINEIVFDIQNKRDYYFHTSLNYRLGEIS